MGVQSLGQLLKECPEAVTLVQGDDDLEQFDGQRWLIDTSVMMHRFVNACSSIDNNEHLHCFMNLHKRLLSYNIQPLFIFDGKTTMAKHDEIQRRTVAKQRAMAHAKDKVSELEIQVQELLSASQKSSTDSTKTMSAPEEPAPTIVEPSLDGMTSVVEKVDDMARIVRLAQLQGQLGNIIISHFFIHN